MGGPASDPFRRTAIQEGWIAYNLMGHMGRLLHHLQPGETGAGDIYLELYLNDPGSSNQIGLYRRGTRVLQSMTELDWFQKEPWTAGYLQGIIDACFVNLTPGNVRTMR